MTLTALKHIENILHRIDSAYQSQMLLARKEEELMSKKYDISNQIYSFYANDHQKTNDTADNHSSFNWLARHFYQSEDNLHIWDKNWTFDEYAVLNGRRYGKFLLCKDGQIRLASPGDFISSTSLPNLPRSADLRIKRLEILDNAWFYFRGNKQLGNAFLTRIYFNFNYCFETIAAFSKDLHHELNSWLIPFEYKFASNQTTRLDNGVLYTTREHYLVVFYLVKKIAGKAEYSGLFGTNTLPFTKATGLHGISFGEEPPIKNSSFGKYRADILADIYIDYYSNQQNETKKLSLKSFVNKKLTEKGFDLKDFFRNPHSNYPYDFSIFRSAHQVRKKDSKEAEDKYLTWALSIGKLICKNAIVINKENITQCYWLSLIEDETGSFEYRLTDNSFSEGRLGIIYFLARLYNYYPDEYLFRFICNTVLKSMPDCVYNDNNTRQIFEEINLCLNSSAPKILSNKAKPLFNHFLAYAVDKTITDTNSYTQVENDAPQPVINKGYAALGLILLAMYERDYNALSNMEGFYAHNTLLKVINQVRF